MTSISSSPNTGAAPDSPAVPPGFERIDRGSPFLGLVGPIYIRRNSGQDKEQNLVLAMRVDAQHLNVQGIAHGGMLVTLADSALGVAIKMANGEKPMVTVNLSTDFVESARAGDWLEAHVDIQRIGRRMAFANCYLKVGERRILRASGVFAAVG